MAGALKESSTYQKILREGLAEGRALGRAEGRAEGVRDAIVQVGTVRLGRPDPTTRALLDRKAYDLVVLETVSFGAEVFADGNVHVYAPLRGRAIAGARGNADARIFTTCLDPQLVAIAGVYRTIETALPDEVAGKPAQIRRVGDSLLIEPL